MHAPPACGEARPEYPAPGYRMYLLRADSPPDGMVPVVVSSTQQSPSVPAVPEINGVQVEQFVSVGESMVPATLAAGRPHVVVIGGGFGGLNCVQELKDANVDITLIDRRNHHLFVPLLYQVAAAELTQEHVAVPLRRILKGQKNVTVLYDEAVDIDAENRIVKLEKEPDVQYDYLVIAIGAKDSYFGNDQWAQFAWGLKSLEDAERIRQKILLNFEAAEAEPDPERRAALLTYVLVGGGPTGVEMSGAIAELARFTLPREYKNFNTRDTRVILLEGMDRIFPGFDPKLSKAATRDLEKLGVEVRTGAMVTNVDEKGVEINKDERINADTVIWAAGIQARRLTGAVADVAQLDRAKRIIVTPELNVAGHPEIFAIGDCASIAGPNGRPLPGVAQVAQQGGAHVAKNIVAAMQGLAYSPFKYRDYGSMATIGRNRAVANIGKFRFTGYPAWAMWAFVHIWRLVNFRSRTFVFFQWAFDYFGYNRNARILLDTTYKTRQGNKLFMPGEKHGESGNDGQ